MVLLRRRRHHITAYILLFFLSISAFSAIELTRPDPVRFNQVETELQRRRLIGPGSSPPSCRSKCGQCTPCKPVHVAIKPGFVFPLEYYPEAWRCKCGNKLFMP